MKYKYIAAVCSASSHVESSSYLLVDRAWTSQISLIIQQFISARTIRTVMEYLTAHSHFPLILLPQRCEEIEICHLIQ